MRKKIPKTFLKLLNLHTSLSMVVRRIYESQRDLLIGQFYKRSNTSVASRVYTKKMLFFLERFLIYRYVFFFSDFHIKALLIGALLAPYIYAQSSPDAQTFQSDAAQGNAKAQYNLGLCYYGGKGVSRSDSEAVFWWHKAAEQGLDRAQFNLGNHYYRGLGVSQSYSEAISWWRKAAEQGHVRAQYNLGLCYFEGKGTAQSSSDAVIWWCKAAEQGDARAQSRLGECYEKGKGVPQSYKTAAEWLLKAAKQEDAEAQYNLGCYYYEGKGVSQSFDRAVEWFRKAANQNALLKFLVDKASIEKAHPRMGFFISLTYLRNKVSFQSHEKKRNRGS